MENSTIEYVSEDSAKKPPIFLFVLDTVMLEAELDALKSAMTSALRSIPSDAHVGLITFGRDVFVHELAVEEFHKSHVFKGTQPITPARLAQAFGGRSQPPARAAAPPNPERKEDTKHTPSLDTRNRFIVPFADYELQFMSVISELSRDTWFTDASTRQERATGAALSAAISLLELLAKGQNARILTFIAGPCTVANVGAVVSKSFAEPIRTDMDLRKKTNNARFFESASKFYDGLATQALTNGHVVDLFAAHIDQVGLAEMISCASKTGGQVVLDDSFTHNVFVGSIQKIFMRDPLDPNDLAMAFNAETHVLVSKELKIGGAIGNLTAIDRKSPTVSPNPVGVGGTCAWRLGALDHTTSFAVYFELANQTPAKDEEHSPTPIQGSTQAYIQIITKYRTSSGVSRLRVTTVAKTFAHFSNPTGFGYLKAGFDQEAAAVLVTRMAIFRAQTEHYLTVMRWLDRTLIKLVSRFATYTKGQPETLKLGLEFSYYPHFMFHLRRSQLIQVFNSSPDETAFFRFVCSRQNCVNTLIMIQPTLMSYKPGEPPAPAPLDMAAMAPDRILLLDTFFNVVIWYGADIQKWSNEGLQNRPGYEYFGEFLQQPVKDAQALMQYRFPSPRFIECIQNGSQQRFLTAKLNPSTARSEAEGALPGENPDEPPVFTEDVSLKRFLQHLRKLAVQQ